MLASIYKKVEKINQKQQRCEKWQLKVTKTNTTSVCLNVIVCVCRVFRFFFFFEYFCRQQSVRDSFLIWLKKENLTSKGIEYDFLKCYGSFSRLFPVELHFPFHLRNNLPKQVHLHFASIALFFCFFVNETIQWPRNPTHTHVQH